jgi:hypothetical protein
VPCKLAMLVLAMLSVAAFASDRDEGIWNTFPNERIPGRTYSSVRQIDFQNSPIINLRWKRKPDWPSLQDGSLSRKVVIGRFHNDPIYGSEEVELKSVRYFRCQAKDGNCALVRFQYCSTGASVSCEGVAEVISLDGQGYPTIRQKIEYDLTHHVAPDELWAHFYPERPRLIVSGVHGWYQRIIITFDWNGEKFVPVGRKILTLRDPPR